MPFITYQGRKIWVDNSVSERNHHFFASMGWKNQGERDDYQKRVDENSKLAYERHRQRTYKRQQKANEKYEAKINEKHGSMENYLNKVVAKDKITNAKINAVAESPQLAKANRNTALTGSKYYKQNMANQGNPDAPYLDSIHCANCSQRLGNSISPCPLCKNQSLKHIYGYMLSHPSDPRWLLPKYSENRFNHPSEAKGLQALSDRKRDAGNLDDLR